MEKILNEYSHTVRLVIKFYPYKYRDYARSAAEAALAAYDQGKFQEMHTLLLKRSPKLDRNCLISYAREIGLDMNAFMRAIDSQKNDWIIERDIKLALELDLFNTPAFFVNGRKVVGNVPYAYLKKIVEEELHAKS